jgi:hypothetical protein
MASDTNNCSVAVRGESDHLVVPHPAASAQSASAVKQTEFNKGRDAISLAKDWLQPIEENPRSDGVADYSQAAATDKQPFMGCQQID